jgi:hypothetical protein
VRLKQFSACLKCKALSLNPTTAKTKRNLKSLFLIIVRRFYNSFVTMHIFFAVQWGRITTNSLFDLTKSLQESRYTQILLDECALSLAGLE